MAYYGGDNNKSFDKDTSTGWGGGNTAAGGNSGGGGWGGNSTGGNSGGNQNWGGNSGGYNSGGGNFGSRGGGYNSGNRDGGDRGYNSGGRGGGRGGYGGGRGGQDGGGRGRGGFGGGRGGGGRGGRGGRGGGRGGHNGQPENPWGPGCFNSFVSGSVCVRFLFPGKIAGSIIGKGGAKIKEIRTSSNCKITIDGQEDDRCVAIRGQEISDVCNAMSQMLDNIDTDFGKERGGRRPPIVLGPHQKRHEDDDYQLCLLINEGDVGAIIGHGGTKIKEIQDETKSQICVFKEFPTSQPCLPNSSDKIVTITCDKDTMVPALEVILTNFQTELRGGRTKPGGKPWNVLEDPPTCFYSMATSGPSNKFGGRGGGMGGPGGMGGGMHGGGMRNAGVPIPNIDPFVQKLFHVKDPQGNIHITANIDQTGTIMGAKGFRINEIRGMSNAQIKIDDLEGDSALRQIHIMPGAGGPTAVENALWLMNICINAFCFGEASACPFPVTAPLQEVVMSGSYGKPPGLQNAQQNGQQNQQNGQQQQQPMAQQQSQPPPPNFGNMAQNNQQMGGFGGPPGQAAGFGGGQQFGGQQQGFGQQNNSGFGQFGGQQQQGTGW